MLSLEIIKGNNRERGSGSGVLVEFKGLHRNRVWVSSIIDHHVEQPCQIQQEIPWFTVDRLEGNRLKEWPHGTNSSKGL